MAERKIVLKSSDGQVFEVEESLFLESQTIKRMIESNCADNTISVPITGNILSKIIEYVKRHADPFAIKADLKVFDAEFKNVDQATLFDIIRAANQLDIKSLLDLTCQIVADSIKGKTPVEIRNYFNFVKKDLGPGEEEEVQRNNA